MKTTMKVIIISGSYSDKDHVKEIEEKLRSLHVPYESFIASAHRDPKLVLELIDDWKDGNIVFITVAGLSNALSGMVAANTKHPVIACPPFKDHQAMVINIWSSILLPKQVPVLFVLHPENAALAAFYILNNGAI